MMNIPAETLDDQVRLATEAVIAIERAANSEEDEISPRQLADAFRTLLTTVQGVVDRQRLLVTTEIQKLQLQPGDGLVVLLGDRASGWIPTPEAGEQSLQLFKRLVHVEMGLPDVPVAITHFGHEFGVVRPGNGYSMSATVKNS